MEQALATSACHSMTEVGSVSVFSLFTLDMSIKAKTMSFESKKIQNMMMEIKVDLIFKIKWVRN